MELPSTYIRKAECRELARWILNLDRVFIDTETTGFGNNDEVITAAAVNAQRDILFNIEVRPAHITEIPAAATAVHGYTYEMLKQFVTIDNWAAIINRCLDGRYIVAYNATFDIRMLYQSLGQFPDPKIKFGAAYKGIFDAMQLYSKFNGAPGKYGSQYAWHKLGEAAKIENIEFDAGSLHGALADTMLTVELLEYIANWDNGDQNE